MSTMRCLYLQQKYRAKKMTETNSRHMTWDALQQILFVEGEERQLPIKWNDSPDLTLRTRGNDTFGLLMPCNEARKTISELKKLENIRAEAVDFQKQLHIYYSTSNKGLAKTFYGMLIEIADLIQVHNESPQKAIRTVAKDFGNLILEKKILSKEKQIGLYGELLTLKQLIKSHGDKAIKEDQGPFIEPRDGITSEGNKPGLWANIHAKRKRGEPAAKKGDEDYPKTLNVEGVMSKDKEDHDTGGFRISDKKAKEAKERVKKKKAEHDNRYSDGTGEESKKKKEALEKKRGMKLDGHPEFTRDDYTFYDICLSYLDENYILESVEEAEEILMQLTGAQIVEIIDEFMNDPSVVEQKATAVDGHGNTYRDYNNDGLSARQQRMKKFGDKRAAMLAKGV